MLFRSIWVICDASSSGVGAVYGQGPEWQTCRPAGFMSKKFTSAQMNYRVFEAEMIAILEALAKWEDKLLGRKFNIVTDHKALEFFQTQRNLSARQMRWMEFLSRFDHEIIYVKGLLNLVADCLSRYYENDHWDEKTPSSEMVNIDVRLDPMGETLPLGRFEELRVMRLRLREKVEDRVEESAKLNEGTRSEPDKGKVPPISQEEVSWTTALTKGPPLMPIIAQEIEFMTEVKKGYKDDTTFNKIIRAPEEHQLFEVRDGAIWTKNRQGNEVLCVPRSMVKKRRLTGIVIDHAHTVIGHMGAQKTDEYVRNWFWWPTLAADIRKFCQSCGICQATKSSNKHTQGLLHHLPIPGRPWGSTGMDFVGPFPNSLGFDYLWVVICRLTSMVHLIPINTTTKTSELAWKFVTEIVRLHGLPDSIVSDRDPKFTAKFWREVHRMLGSKLMMSTAFHPQTDGATERAIRSVNQILRAMVRPDQRDWAEKIPLVEFAMNSTVSATTGYAPFELNYGMMPRMVREFGDNSQLPGIRLFANRIRESLLEAHDAIIDSRIYQTEQANRKRRAESGLKDSEDQFREGGLVYLSTKNLSLPKGRASKLLPRFLGPFKIIGSHPSTSNYTLDLPEELKARRIHPTFHASLLRPHEPNDTQLFPQRDPNMFYDFGSPDDAEWLVDEIIGHRWEGRRIQFLVKWNLGDSTWEPYDHCKELEALDTYLDLHGITDWRKLPRKS